MNLNQGLWQQQTIKIINDTRTNTSHCTITILLTRTSEFLEEKAMENPLLQIESLRVKSMDPSMIQ